MSFQRLQTKAETLLNMASESLALLGSNSTFSMILVSNIKLILAINEQILQAEIHIDDIDQSLPQYQLLNIIPGIGPTNAMQILCEIGLYPPFPKPQAIHSFLRHRPFSKSFW